jgi:peptide/nickel transport system substrate-binding protein
MRFKKPIVAVSTAALLSLAACGGSGTGEDTNAGPGPAEEDVTKAGEGGAAGQGKNPELSEGPAPEVEGAQTGGTMKVISFAGLNTMDPSEAYYTNTISILTSLVTRTLTQYAYDEKTNDMVLIPDLATDLGTPNEDYTEWTFTIRDGVRYENGQEVTCDDLAFGLKRSMDRATFPEGADYSNVYFLDGDTYKGPYKSGNQYDGVTCKGSDLTIKMSKPFPDMDYYGAFPTMGPIPEGKVSDPAKYRLHPWATGPYMFDEYTPEKSLTLVKNPEWDPATDPGRHQYVDEYQMEFDVPTAKIDQIMLQDQGDAQTTVSPDNVDAADYLPFKQEAPDRLIVGSDPCTFMWFPDYRKIKEIEVRQALAYAYPYEDTYAALGLIPGVTRTYGTNILPPGIPEREEYNPLPDHEPGSTDPAKSKQLLADAGYKPGEYKISFAYLTDDPSSVDSKDQIVAGLKAGGFDPKPVATTIAESSTLRADPDAPLNVRSGGWCSDWPSGGSWFPPVFGSPNLEEGLGANYAVFSEPEVDKEIERIQSLPIEEQPAAWNAMDKMIMEKYFPVFVTGYGGVAMMRGSKVNNMQVDTTTGMPHWKDMWLSQ